MRSTNAQRAAAILLTAGCLATSAQADPPHPTPPQPAAARPSAAPTTTPKPTAPVRPLTRPLSELRHLLSTVPKLALFASEFSPLPSAATKTAIERSGRTRESITSWTFVDGPFEWTPNAKHSYWIVFGSAGPRVVIAVFEPGPEPKHLASTVLLESEPAVAIGWSPNEPSRLLWTTCYGCQGLGGSIDLDAEGQVTFVYR